jgi:hypothetical protein
MIPRAITVSSDPAEFSPSTLILSCPRGNPSAIRRLPGVAAGHGSDGCTRPGHWARRPG